MALVEGTDAGFVTVSPTAAAGGAVGNLSAERIRVCSYTASSSGNVGEMGAYLTLITGELGGELAIYEDNAGEPGDLMEVKVVETLVLGWNKITTFDVDVVADTQYWIGFSAYNTTNIDINGDTGGVARYKPGVYSFPDPWPVATDTASTYIQACYALIGDAPPPVEAVVQLQIGDAWKEYELMKINIGDTWKTVEGLQINIGDSWKTIF